MKKIISISKAYATKCKMKVCIDPLGTQFQDQTTHKMVGKFSDKKPKSQYYLNVILTDYIENGNRLQKTEYYLPNGKIIYSSDDCSTKKCNKEEELKIKEILGNMTKANEWFWLKH